jgi:hypothetical protein
LEDSCSESVEQTAEFLAKRAKNTLNPIGMKVAQLGLMTSRFFEFFVVMSAAKTLSKKMFELAAKDETRVGSQPKVSMRRSLEQSFRLREDQSRQEQTHEDTHRLSGHGSQRPLREILWTGEHDYDKRSYFHCAGISEGEFMIRLCT